MTAAPKDLGSILDRFRELAGGSPLAAAVRGELPRDRGAVLEFEKGRRGRLVERLEEAKQARGRAVERFDAEVVRLEKQIKELDELVRRVEEGGRGEGGGPGPRPAATGRGLADIEGVGPTYRERLERAGFADAAAVGAADPERLAAALGIPVSRATTIVENAVELLKG